MWWTKEHLHMPLQHTYIKYIRPSVRQLYDLMNLMALSIDKYEKANINYFKK